MDWPFMRPLQPMRFRKLRIAWSVFWGVVAVLLVVLWLRSYWCNDSFDRTQSTNRLYGWGVETSLRNFPGNIEYRSDKITSGTILSTGWRHAYYDLPIDRM